MTLTEILDRLAVPRGGLLYVHSSADWLRGAGIPPTAVLPALVDWVGLDGTLVMPSYPTRAAYADYVRASPVYDVHQTPTAAGLIAEVYRRTPGVIRSLAPDYPVAALGPDAAAIADHPLGEDPFDEESSYRRMLRLGGTMVGLGVSLNTNSFVHVFDSMLEPGYPAPVYLPDAVVAGVVDREGRTLRVPRRLVRPDVQRLTQPSAIAAAVGPSDMFARLDVDGTQFFCWDLQALEQWALQHGRARAGTGRWPCWLERMGRTDRGETEPDPPVVPLSCW